MDNKEKYIKAFKELGQRYGFSVKSLKGKEVLTAKNTDNKNVNWLSYNPVTDTISIFGNTDNLNIWLYETREDFTPEKVIQFVNDLNEVFEMEGKERILVQQLIDPEDWQEIANVQDAYEDSRYNTK